jgi:hypothetical protein
VKHVHHGRGRSPHLACAAPLVGLALLLAPAARAAAPVALERFVPADADMVILVRSLEALSVQGKALLDAAGRFPGVGDEVLDARAVVTRRLGFDPLDLAAVKAAGLDPKRGAVLHLRERADAGPDGAIVLPVADVARFEAAVARFARTNLARASRTVLPGSPRIVRWSSAERPQDSFAYTFAGRYAVIGVDQNAAAQVRATLALPAAKQLAGSRPYEEMAAAVGRELPVMLYVPASSLLVRDNRATQVFTEGLAAGVGGDASAARLILAVPLDEERAGGEPASPALVQLDPGAALVVQSRADIRTLFPRAFQRGFAGDYWGSLGAGAAVAFTVVPPREAAGDAEEAPPFVGVKFEMVLGLSDPDTVKAFFRQRAREGATEDGPWLSPHDGREVGVAVEGNRLFFADGGPGALKALLARTGTRFQPPTAAAARALAAPLIGGYVDLQQAGAELQRLPADTLEGQDDEPFRWMKRSAELLAPLRAVSVRCERMGRVARLEVIADLAEGPGGERVVAP